MSPRERRSGQDRRAEVQLGADVPLEGFELVSPSGAAVVRPERLDARSRAKAMAPSLFTLTNMLCGFSSLRASQDGNFDLAAVLIGVAVLFDIFDGAVARAVRAITPFGLQFDSLADLISFGIAPAFLLYNWGLRDAESLRSFGWICLMIFALASAMRLARFNVAADEDVPKWQKNYFTGMPTPAAAIVVLLPFYLERLGWYTVHGAGVKVPTLLYVLTIAFLMVSTIPTYSGKLMGERISRELVLPIFMLAVGVVALLFTYPIATLAGGTLIYMAVIPVSWSRFKSQQARDAAAAGAAGAEPATTASAPAEAEDKRLSGLKGPSEGQMLN